MKSAAPAGPGNIIFIILHPLGMTLIAALVLLFGNTVLSVVPVLVKWYLTGMIALTTLVIPALLISLFKVFRIIPQEKENERKSRIFSLIAVAACYLMCYIILSRVNLAFLLNKVVMSAIVCTVFAAIVSLFWKISLHMIGTGGVIAIFWIFNYAHFATIPYILLVSVLLAGLLASARLYQGHHTPAQVLAGFLAGFIISSAVILFF